MARCARVHADTQARPGTRGRAQLEHGPVPQQAARSRPGKRRMLPKPRGSALEFRPAVRGPRTAELLRRAPPAAGPGRLQGAGREEEWRTCFPGQEPKCDKEILQRRETTRELTV